MNTGQSRKMIEILNIFKFKIDLGRIFNENINGMRNLVGQILTFFCIQLTVQITAAEQYKYSELEIKNYDELLNDVRNRIQQANRVDAKARKEAGSDTDYDSTEAVFILKDALKMVFSRPNKDNMIEKLLPELRNELKSYEVFYDSINDMVVEAISALKQKIPIVYKSTYIFILENFMSEFRPELKRNPEIKKIFIYIRDSNVVVPDDVRLDRKLRSMFNSRDPSDTAKKILDLDLPEAERKEPKKGFWQRLFG